MSETLDTAREAIREAAEADVPAFQRVERLQEIGRELRDAAVEVDEAIREAEAAREDDQLDVGLAVMYLRQRATLTDELVDAGQITEADAVSSGVLRHDDLDAMEDAGLLDAAAHEMVAAGVLSTAPDGDDGEGEPAENE